MLETGKKMRRLREAAGLTRRQLADYLGVSQDVVCGLEDVGRAISADVLEQLADLFCCPVSALVSGEPAEPAFGGAFRGDAISAEDLRALAAVNRVAKNLLWMGQVSGT